MNTETVHAHVDYLGHPCQISAAIHRLDELVADERGRETRALVRHIGRGLTEFLQRDEYAMAASALALQSLNDSTENDGVRALMTMAQAYQEGTANVVGRLFAQMLIALDRGGLLEGDAATSIAQ